MIIPIALLSLEVFNDAIILSFKKMKMQFSDLKDYVLKEQRLGKDKDSLEGKVFQLQT